MITKTLTALLTTAALFSAVDAMQQIPQQGYSEASVVQTTKKKTCKKWTSKENELLRNKVNELGCNWNVIANFFPGRTVKAIADHWYVYINDGSRHWTSEENDLLRLLVQQFGHKWSMIAKFFPGRNRETLRKQWEKIKRQSVDAAPNRQVEQPAPVQSAISGQPAQTSGQFDNFATEDFDGSGFEYFEDGFSKDDFEF